MKNCQIAIIVWVLGYILPIYKLDAQSWEPIPAQIHGIKVSGLISSTITSTLIVSSLKGGIYRSMDSGNSWEKVSTWADSIFVLTKQDEAIVWAGGKGSIFKSIDSGKTWVRLPFPHHTPISSILVHPTGKLIVGTGSFWDYDSDGNGKGIWMSDDDGQTWRELNNGIPSQNMMIKTLAIDHNENLYAGILDNEVGTKGKLGILKLPALSQNWQRVYISIKAPHNTFYTDDYLRIASVFNIHICNNKLYACISGVYTNFAMSNTIVKSLGEMDNPSSYWQVQWVKDSLPSNGSFFEQLTSIFIDSKGRHWASVSNPETELGNDIYEGDLAIAAPWRLRLQKKFRGNGKFIFTEDGTGNIYTSSYGSYDSIFVFKSEDPMGSPDKSTPNGEWILSPNPFLDHIDVQFIGSSNLKNIQFSIRNLWGAKLYEKVLSPSLPTSIYFDGINLPTGIYFVTLEKDGIIQKKKLIKQ